MTYFGIKKEHLINIMSNILEGKTMYLETPE